MNTLALKISGAKNWHDKGYTGKGVTIAVLDNFEMGEVIMPYNPNLPASHGLNVCKSALITAPEADIFMLKWKGRGADKDRCIDWIHDNKPELINVSLGGIYLQAKKFEELESYPLLCATGNNAKDKPDYPARFDFALAVGSWNHNLNRVASYSNRGEDVFGLNPYIQNSQGNWWSPMGTSFATPFVSGLAACYIQLFKERGVNLTTQQIYDLVKANKNEYGLFVLPEKIPEAAPSKEVEPMQIILQIDKKTAIVDGKTVSLDVPPVLQNGRTLVPLRFVAEELAKAFDKKVTFIWDNNTQTVTLNIE